mmetsp:Transcript_60351/g.153056  ORF Transcript_60351/g.153056 Transcript_60351/m.153056 type:complete len:84 (+) Transcript_60351:410-661(+)
MHEWVHPIWLDGDLSVCMQDGARRVPEGLPVRLEAMQLPGHGVWGLCIQRSRASSPYGASVLNFCAWVGIARGDSLCRSACGD